MVLLDSNSLDTMPNVPDFLASQSFRIFFQDVCKMSKLKIFGSALYLLLDSCIPFSNLLHCSVAIVSKFGLKTWLFQRAALLVIFTFSKKI